MPFVMIAVLIDMVSSPVLGALSDAHGRRPVMLLGFGALALTFFATAFAKQLWMLILARAVGGAMQANVSVANAYVADITPPEDRARRFGMLGAMFGIGFILGPVLGGFLGSIRLQLPFLVAGTLALASRTDAHGAACGSRLRGAASPRVRRACGGRSPVRVSRAR